jgi:hypothetical protein
VDYARRKKVKVLVAETPDRFLRHPEWTPHRQDLQPSQQDWEKLKQITGDLILVTLIDPSSSSSDMRSQQTKRGQEQKGRKGGRPRHPFYYEEQRKDYDLVRSLLSQLEQIKES